jgi:DNA-binding protein YbaB
MVLAAVDGAIKKSREMAAAEMKKVTAGMGLPPGMMGI